MLRRGAVMSVAAAIIAVRAAAGQAADDPVNEAMKAAKFPAVVRPGLRLVYYVAASHTPGPAFYRDDSGDFVDENGRRYSRTGTTGGHGCSQLDVLACDGKVAAVSLRGWTYHEATGPLYPISLNGYAFAPDNTEWWMHPDILRTLPEVHGAELRIFRAPYRVLRTGKVFDRTLVIFRHNREVRAQRVYDLQTGLLIHTDSAQRTADGSTGVHRIDLVSQREVEFPWKNDAAPAWVADTRAMHFRGALTLVDPRIPPAPMPMFATYTLSDRRNNWAVVKCSVVQQTPTGLMAKSEAGIVSGPNMVGGLWIHPDTIARLAPGSVLDRDESLGTRVDAGAVGNGRAVITETGALHTSAYVYDARTGALTEYRSHNRGTHNLQEMRLTQMER